MPATNAALGQSRTPSTGRLGSYSAWVRATISALRDRRSELVTLFESSVPEPWPLLRDLVADGIGSGFDGRYVDTFVAGNRFVVEALTQRYGVAADHLVCTTGATSGLALCFRALLGPGDEVLVETPGFDLFGIVARSQGLSTRAFARSGPRWEVDLEQLARTMSPRTRMVVLSNLHNPSGFGLSGAQARELAAFAARHDLWIVIDEVYSDYGEPDLAGNSLASLSPHFICVSSLTKIFGLAALRCGWVSGHAPAIGRIRLVAEEVEFGISKLTHAAASAVLADPAPFARFTADILASARPLLEDHYRNWLALELVEGELPPSGCISFPRISGVSDTEALADWIVAKAGLMVAPGEYFGAAGHLRIGHGKPADDLERALDALTGALIEYRDLGLGDRS